MNTIICLHIRARHREWFAGKPRIRAAIRLGQATVQHHIVGPRLDERTSSWTIERTSHKILSKPMYLNTPDEDQESGDASVRTCLAQMRSDLGGIAALITIARWRGYSNCCRPVATIIGTLLMHECLL